MVVADGRHTFVVRQALARALEQSSAGSTRKQGRGCLDVGVPK